MTCGYCQAPIADGARFCPACGKATVPTATQAESMVVPALDMVGKEIAGRYRILAKLGEGGMGAVYRGEQISLRRAVAVKLLKPELSANQQLVGRFKVEAEAVAKLSHPNTVNIYDFGQGTDGALFIAMEYIDGQSLRGVIHGGPLPPARALYIAVQIAASLTDAHAHSIVHRDLKPDNVMLQDRGRHRDIVRVLDFGIAKLRDDSRATQQAMTQAGDMLGTPQYMAPEQIRGEAIDGRTDIYALGCLLYEMVTARLPFEAATVMAMLSKHLLEPPVPPSQRRPDLGISPALDQLVLAAMAKDPTARPPTMEVYGEQLAAVLASLPPDPNRSASTPLSAVQPAISTPQLTPPPPASYTPQPQAAAHPVPSMFGPSQLPTMHRIPKQGGSRKALYGVLGVLALGGAGLGVWAATRSGPHQDRPPEPSQPAPGNDVWGNSSAPEVPDIASSSDTLPPGAGLRVPPGFEQTVDTPQAKLLVDKAHGVLVALGPLDRSSDDPDVLAKLWASQQHVHYEDKGWQFSHGHNRPVARFTAGAFKQAIVFYISPGARVGVLIAAPVALANTRPFEDWVGRFLESNLVLPP